MKEFKINANEAGQRFDKYLKKLLKEANTSFIYKMLRKKNIVLNGKKADGKLKKWRPETLAQAARISGVNPADIAILAVIIKRGKH